jgi:protein-tyrosine phosphatase
MDVTPIDDQQRLFVSSSIDDWSSIEEHGISVVVDLEEDVDAGIPSGDGTILYLYYPFEDESVPDPTMLRPLATFLAELYDNGHRVLVHCGMGLNRSPLVAGVVLHQLGWKSCDVVERLCERRPGALFNATYRSYLEGLSGELRT